MFFQFENVLVKWAPEVRHHCSDASIILVGTKADLRDDKDQLYQLAKIGQYPVKKEAAERMAKKIHALKYIESSALTQVNVKKVFEEVVRSVFQKQKPILKENNKCQLM